MIDTYNPTPTVEFPYTMQTTAVMEHSRGIAWTANLLRKGRVVGTIEQAGDGSADRVYFDQQINRVMWITDVAMAFGGNEEDATYFLLVQEEGE